MSVRSASRRSVDCPRTWLGLLTAFCAATAGAQHGRAVAAVTVAGHGPETYVLLTGLVGGVAGFRRLERLLLVQGYRVIVIDPYRLSVDSADVSFAALARRVDAVLTAKGVESARVVGHAHGGGVALRLAARAPQRVTALYLLDVGALAVNHTRVLGGALRLVPVLARIPGGRAFLRERYVRGIRQSAGRQEWFDTATQRDYTEPVLNDIGRAVALAFRISRSREPEALATLVARLRVPAVVLVGAVPHPSGPEADEFTALAPLGGLLRVDSLAGVGHFPHEEAPAEVARYLLAPRAVVDAPRTVGARGRAFPVLPAHHNPSALTDS